MKLVKITGASVIVAAVIGVALASASYGAPGFGGSPFAGEMAVLTSKGISPERARQALDVQGKIAQANLVSDIEAAMGDAYAGAWFEPATAQVHVGVTSEASRRAAQHTVAQAGLTAVVTYTPVRSTWLTLMAVQSSWNKRLVDLFASQDAMTGLDAQRSAVVVTLSSSVPAGERATLEREAATGRVNVVVEIAPQPHLAAEPTAKCKLFKTFEAYCEKTLVSGVGIAPGSAEPLCSAGPSLITGNETYMLTAGHCFAPTNAMGEPEVGKEGAVKVEVTSAYPEEKEKPEQKRIGKTGEWKYLLSKDMAIVKITRPGSFNQGLPTPVPALMMEWGVKTETPSTVIGEAANLKGEANCREGMTSGKACGEILRVNITTPSGFEHLVEDTACAEGGDSGGPFYFSKNKVNNVTMQGMLVRRLKKCGEEGAKSWYEPLKDEGAEKFGILSNFPGKTLLTTTNETRPAQKLGILPGKGNTFTSTSGKGTLETVGGSKIECASDSVEGKLSSETAGEATIIFKGCKALGFAANSLGQAKEEIKTEVALTLCYLNKAKAEVGILTELKKALHIEVPSLATLLSVTGSAVGKITPVNSEETTGPFELKFEQGKGKQTQTKCEGGSEESFKTAKNEGTAEQTGEATSEETTFKESTEVMG
jgi:hypothetical protein